MDWTIDEVSQFSVCGKRMKIIAALTDPIRCASTWRESACRAVHRRWPQSDLILDRTEFCRLTG